MRCETISFNPIFSSEQRALGSPTVKTLSFVSGTTEKRRALRRAVRLRASLRQAGLPPFAVEVDDLSTSGFRMRNGVTLSPPRLWLTLPTFQALECVVRWHDGQRCGCEFDVPLHVAVFDHVLGRNGPHKRGWQLLA